MKTLQDYFAEIARLIGFLLEREGQYRVTSDGPVFDQDEDTDRYGRKMDEIVRLEEQLESAVQEAEEILNDVPVTH